MDFLRLKYILQKKILRLHTCIQKWIFQKKPHRHPLAFFGLLGCLALLLVMQDQSTSKKQQVSLDWQKHAASQSTPSFTGKNLESETLIDQYQNTPLADLLDSDFAYLKIQAGETFSEAFFRKKIGFTAFREIIAFPAVKRTISALRAGDGFFYRLNLEKNSLDRLVYIPLRGKDIVYWEIDDKDGLKSLKKTRTHAQRSYFSGTIASSFFTDAIASGIPENLVMNIFEIFKWEIDFIYDLRPGDRFFVLVDQFFDLGLESRILDSNILAAGFMIGGKPKIIYRYTDATGRLLGFFDEQGYSNNKSFLRMPLPFGRVSSRFNLRRVHPLFKTVRPHYGTDYAAPTGTPVFAAGSGRVSFAGTKQGYGKVVYIDHANHVQTRYAHLSRIQVRSGAFVRQSQVIGRVGSTGFATGPHLHYEFRLKGLPRNPERVSLSERKKLPKKKREEFLTANKHIIADFKHRLGQT